VRLLLSAAVPPRALFLGDGSDEAILDPSALEGLQFEAGGGEGGARLRRDVLATAGTSAEV
jgi:hypothetical protein